MVGDNFLVRGYEDGKHFATREKFYPTLFVNSKKKTKYRTLNGKYVESIEPGSVRDCRDFIKKYRDIENFDIYGNERFIYQYISDKYPQDEVKFDIDKIKLVTLDIEVKSEYGFPDVESAAEEILLISIQDYTTKQIITWGQGPFNNKQKNVTYKAFRTEYALLHDFINFSPRILSILRHIYGISYNLLFHPVITSGVLDSIIHQLIKSFKSSYSVLNAL